MLRLILKRVPLDFNWPRGKPFEGEIPLGAGYQIWDDDPSPASPVVKTEDGIILWLVEQGYSRKKAVQIVRGGEKLPEN